ncbi:MAG: hypothetical protein RRZ73_05890 [Oscillospiraceae bacterium]
MQIVQYGLYNVQDEYFETFKSDFLPDNKQENRPYYVTYIDNDNIIWLIPLSSQVESYKIKIEKNMKKHGKCLFYHIGIVAGKERVFLIGNMFPVTDKYIKKEYTLIGKHYVVGNKSLIKELHSKATKYLRLVADGKLKPNVDILSIKQALLI